MKTAYINNDLGVMLGYYPISVPVPAHYNGSNDHKKYEQVLQKVNDRLALLTQKSFDLTITPLEFFESKFLMAKRTFVHNHLKDGLPFAEFVFKYKKEDLLFIVQLLVAKAPSEVH